MVQLKISLMGDTGRTEYPLLDFGINNISAKVLMDNDPNPDVTDPFMKVNAELHLDSNYFNVESGSYEPLIEPWSLTAKVDQASEKQPMICDVASPTILNLNVTHALIIVLKKL